MLSQKARAIKVIAQTKLEILEPAPTWLSVRSIQWESVQERGHFTCRFGHNNGTMYVDYPTFGVFEIEAHTHTTKFIPNTSSSLTCEEIRYLFITRVRSIVSHLYGIANFHASAFLQPNTKRATLIFGLSNSGKTEYLYNLLARVPRLQILADDLIMITIHERKLYVFDTNPPFLLRRDEELITAYPHFVRRPIMLDWEPRGGVWYQINKIMILDNVENIETYLMERIYNYHLLQGTRYDYLLDSSRTVIKTVTQML